MRWKAVYIIMGLAVIFTVIGFCFMDLIMKWSVERSLETIVGARVDASRVHLDLKKLEVTIVNLQIANPHNTWRNIVEAQDIRFQIASAPLYSGKTVIEEIAIDELLLDTPRKSDGKLRRKPLPGPFRAAQAKLNKDIAAMPVINPEVLAAKFDLNRILANYKFQTDLSALDVRHKIEKAGQDWRNNLTELENTKKDIQLVKEKIAAFQAVNPKNIIELNQKLTLLKEVQKTLSSLQDQVSKTKSGFTSQFSGLATDINNLKQIANGDYRSLIKLSELPDFENVNIAEALIGRDLLNDSSVVLTLVDQVQKMMPVNLINPSFEKHVRGGQNIVFPGPKRTYPRFLIKHLAVSGRGTPGSRFQGYRARAAVSGIASEPLLYGAPMLVSLYGQSAQKAYLDLNGTINHLRSDYHDRLKLKMGNLQLPEVQLAKENKYLPTKLKSGVAELDSNLTIEPNHFLLLLQVAASNIGGDYAGKPAPDGITVEIVREMLAKIDRLTINYRLEGFGKGVKLKMKVDSNLNEIISERLKAVIGARIAKQVQALRERVELRLKEKQTELEAMRQQYQAELSEKINQTQTLLDQEKANLDAKKKELDLRKKELEAQMLNGKNQLSLPKF